MEFITVRDLRTRPGQVWKSLEAAGDLVVTSNGRPIALLTAVSDKTLESSLSALRRARAIEAAHRMQRASEQAGLDLLPDRDVEVEIAAVRRRRRARR